MRIIDTSQSMVTYLLMATWDPKRYFLNSNLQLNLTPKDTLFAWKLTRQSLVTTHWSRKLMLMETILIVIMKKKL